MTEIKPFSRLYIAHTVEDMRKVDIMLNGNPYENLICDQCGGGIFEFRTITESTMVISTGKRLAMLEEKNRKVSVIHALKCALCGCEHIIEDLDKEKAEEWVKEKERKNATKSVTAKSSS
jgi:hypothetical protein